MAPPVRVSQSWGGQPAVWPGSEEARRCCPRRTTMAPSGSSGADGLATAVGGERARSGSSGRDRPRRVAASAGAPTASASAASAPAASLARLGEHVHRAAVGHQVAGLVRGRRRTTPAPWRRPATRCSQPVELHRGELGQVGEALDGGTARAALEAGGEGLGQQLGAGGVGDAAGVDRARSARQARPPTNSGGGLVGPQDVGDGVDRGRRRRPRRPAGATGGAGVGALGPATRRPAGSGWRPAPAGPMAAATASAASAATSSTGPRSRIQPDTLRATVSMSDSSGASYCLW